MFSALEVCFWKEVLSRADTTHPNWNKFELDCVGPRHSCILVVKCVNSCLGTSHSAYVATDTESNGAKIDGFLYPNFM